MELYGVINMDVFIFFGNYLNIIFLTSSIPGQEYAPIKNKEFLVKS